MVSNLARFLGEELGLSKEVCYELAIAGLLHDVGKVELEKTVKDRGETLTVEEIKYVRTHSTLSYAMLSDQGYSDFILKSILYHHENYDGSGYPSNLRGEEIPLGARILRVCDAFAALISDRSYRRAFDRETAVPTMIDEVKNFDMKIFLCFMQMLQEDRVKEMLDRCEKLDLKIEEDVL